MNRFLIYGGTVCNSDSSTRSDLLVEEGIIKAVGNFRPEDFVSYQAVNAFGKFIFPGGIDPHVHLSLPTPAGNSSDDFVSGSKAALAGGTTTCIDFVTPRRGQSLTEALKTRQQEAQKSLCNQSLHMGISEWNSRVAEEVSRCMEQFGIRSFKAYLAYLDSIGISVGELEELMHRVASGNGLVMVHCEDGEMIASAQQKLISEGKTAAAFHAISRPGEAEARAVQQVISLAARTDCRTYIVHTSTAEGGRLIRQAKDSGIPVFGETCTQYLILNDSVYDLSKPDEAVMPYVISPPIRSENNRLTLWKGLADGTFDTVATDHCPFNLHGQKDKGKDDFRKIPNGAGGIEHRMSLLYTYGVRAGLISMEQFVSLASTRAAELFGLAGHKGKIATGYDADLVIWDPEAEQTISASTHHQNCDSNIYEGITVKGQAEKVFLNGSVAYQFPGIFFPA